MKKLLLWLVMVVVMLAVLLGAFGSVFNTYASLYLAPGTPCTL